MMSYEAKEGDTSHSESLCLPEGEYLFIIHDDDEDDVCCWNGGGFYSINAEDGALIARGGLYDGDERASFQLPFTSPSLP